MTQTIRIKPRAGIILAGIPAAGADVDAKLAREWLANGLATEDEEPTPADGNPPAGPTRKRKPAAPAREA